MTGPRQSGKTTLARELVPPSSVNYFDLEDPASLRRLDEPMTALEPLQGLVVLDEIQRRPELFPILRVLVDRPGAAARFLVLGSASGELLRQTSETLAGRVALYRLDGFAATEVDDLERLWLRGGFPRSYLAPSDRASMRWRRSFVDTFLARDLPSLTGVVPPTLLRRFWTMLAHRHGQTWSGAEFGRAFGVSHTTVRRYLDPLRCTSCHRGARTSASGRCGRPRSMLPTPAFCTRCSALLPATPCRPARKSAPPGRVS